MKPDWTNAPEWARWAAMDRNGDWFWHEEKPRLTNYDWESNGRVCGIYPGEWDSTLEERPQ